MLIFFFLFSPKNQYRKKERFFGFLIFLNLFNILSSTMKNGPICFSMPFWCKLLHFLIEMGVVESVFEIS